MSDQPTNISDIPRDVLLEIGNYLDDESLLNLLLANKTRYQNDDIFRIIMRRRYPYLIRFKESKESWKHLYLRMVHYIAKLDEDFGFLYIPHPEFDPHSIYKNLSSSSFPSSQSYWLWSLWLILEISDKEYAVKLLRDFLKRGNKYFSHEDIDRAIEISKLLNRENLVKVLLDYMLAKILEDLDNI